MKKTSLLILGLILSAITFAQAPSKMSYQTVVRNSQGKLVVNKSIGVRISILQSTSTGTPVYVETHSTSSNANGLLTLEVGSGSVATGTFSTIDWSQGPYFLKTEMDVNGGINYTISDVTEFVSEPYAMNSKNADNANSVKTLSNGSNVGDMCYWNGTTWVPLNKGTQGQSLTFCDGKPAWTFGGGCPGDVPVLNCSSATNNGTLNATTAASGVTSVISYTGNGGTHNGQVVSSTGVTGLTATLQAGTFANGNGNLTYTITGTPATSGTASFALNIEGKTCTLTRNVLLPVGVISTLECSSATNNGTLTGTITASGVSSVISYTGGNGGTHNGQVVSSTGVTGLTATLQAGTFANGNGNLTFTINGTPVTSGTAIFALSIGGKTCTLTRNVLLPVGVISTLACSSATNNGTLYATTAASGVTSVISYTGGNGGTYDGQVVSSTGVTGLTATLQAGTFANGNGNLTFTINGTPVTSGTAIFALSIGGKTCTLTRDVLLLVGVISTLECSSATNNGTLTGTITASGVTSIISYTGGNGGAHNGQRVKSTGVYGLTATLQAGTFANGNGNLTYTITGRPATRGTASFALNIGGMTCTVTRAVTQYGSDITDIEGNSYKTVYIGTQQWMGENLKTAKYNDGTTIQNVTDNAQWAKLTTGAWSYYKNDAANNTKYGKLYNWYAVIPNNKNVCPSGWHVPTDAEWAVLTNYLDGLTAGGKMKEVGTTNWISPNTDATNTSLFTGLPGGARDYYGNYSGIGLNGNWWSSTEDDSQILYVLYARYLNMSNKIGSARRSYFEKKSGFSVRCLRD